MDNATVSGDLEDKVAHFAMAASRKSIRRHAAAQHDLDVVEENPPAQERVGRDDIATNRPPSDVIPLSA